MKDQEPFSHVSLPLTAPWEDNKNIIWLASCIKIFRNIEKFQFPHRLDVDKKKQLLDIIYKSIAPIAQLKSPILLPAETLQPLEKDYLTEHFLLFEGVQDIRQGDAFIYDMTGQFLALINIKDHIMLQLTDCAGDIESAWQRLVEIENEISKTISFAYSNAFGFLTQDPLQCGTGLIISSYLHVPALIHLHQLQDVLEKEKTDAIAATGLQGSPDELIGDILVLRNAHTLGITEEGIVSLVRALILKIVIAEKHSREIIKAEHAASMKDKISRALGTLKFSYQLDTVEALSALSLIKLGVEIGFIDGMTVRDINKLFFNARRGHLCYLLHENIPNDDLKVRRAQFLRDKLANPSVKFCEK